MAKKPPDPLPLALEALAAALADPTPKVLFGSATSPGFFKGSAQLVKAAARLCEERHWLEGAGEWVGKGASKKQKYRLTPDGVRAVLEQSETLVLLRGLAAAVGQQAASLQSMREQLGLLVEQARPLAEAVGQLARKVEPPDVEAILRRLQSAANTSGTPQPHQRPHLPAADRAWLDDVVRMTTEQRQRDRYQPLSLPRIYAELRQSRPGLSLGEFHDGLRLLRDQGRLRLVPFTRALATIDDPRNALFLDGEVMYYAEPP
jgi:hypothetical protein